MLVLQCAAAATAAAAVAATAAVVQLLLRLLWLLLQLKLLLLWLRLLPPLLQAPPLVLILLLPLRLPSTWLLHSVLASSLGQRRDAKRLAHIHRVHLLVRGRQGQAHIVRVNQVHHPICTPVQCE